MNLPDMLVTELTRLPKAFYFFDIWLKSSPPAGGLQPYADALLELYFPGPFLPGGGRPNPLGFYPAGGGKYSPFWEDPPTKFYY